MPANRPDRPQRGDRATAADGYGDLLIYVERSTLEPDPKVEEISPERIRERAEDVAGLL